MSAIPLAVGRTAEIFPQGDAWVLKLYRAGRSPAGVLREARLTRAARAAGLPVPAVGALMEVDGRVGLLMERIQGESMLAVIARRPWRFPQLARRLADLHVRIHDCPVPGLPDQHEGLAKRITQSAGLPSCWREPLLARLADLPNGERLCHGDFHPDNVILTRRGPVIIDWPDAKAGNPWCDVTRTCLLLCIGSAPEPGPADRILQGLRGWFRRFYRARYGRLRSQMGDPVQAWMPVLAAARLDERVPGEEGRLLHLIQKGLQG